MNRILFVFVALLLGTTTILAQPRPVETSTKTDTPGKPAPASFIVKYEGGMFGYNEKETGTLRFDDANERLVFFGKDQKEKFHVPYKSVLVLYPQSRSVTSTTGNVVRHIPLPGAGLAGLIKEKRRYMTLHFSDPDVETANGVLSFKMEDKQLLESVIRTLADKARLTQRGDAYYRPKKIKSEI